MNDLHDLLSRDGHVTMLSLDRYEVGELDAVERTYLEEHLHACGRCRERHAVVARPTTIPMRPGRIETGSITVASLTVTATVAAAAALLAALASSLWPSPRVVQEAAPGPAGVASAYTSVAQEYSEPPPMTLEVTSHPRGLTVALDVPAFVSVVVVGDGSADGTGGEDGERVLDVVFASQLVESATEVWVPDEWDGYTLVVVGCPEPDSLSVGDRIDESACVAREQVVADLGRDD